MTDRHAAYIVTLADNIREDDAEPTLNALRMIKGVIKVEPVVGNYELQIAQARVDQQWQERIWDFARDANGLAPRGTP